jgi:hypothetical protein
MKLSNFLWLFCFAISQISGNSRKYGLKFEPKKKKTKSSLFTFFQFFHFGEEFTPLPPLSPIDYGSVTEKFVRTLIFWLVSEIYYQR